MPESSIAAVIALSIEIGIQNFPEGIAVAMPLRAEGMGRLKSFWFKRVERTLPPFLPSEPSAKSAR
jgi:ZIP family zinc transporter